MTRASGVSPSAISPKGLNSTDFGFYYMNYHSRLPVVSGHTGTQADAVAGLSHVLGLAGKVGADTGAGLTGH